jgi:cytochrome c oxidase assembly protein subunit 11
MTALARRNGRTAALAALMVACMVGLAFASVPLYRLFCQVTGFGGTPLRAEAYSGSLRPVGKIIRVRFDANTNSGPAVALPAGEPGRACGDRRAQDGLLHRP